MTRPQSRLRRDRVWGCNGRTSRCPGWRDRRAMVRDDRTKHRYRSDLCWAAEEATRRFLLAESKRASRGSGPDGAISPRRPAPGVGDSAPTNTRTVLAVGDVIRARGSYEQTSERRATDRQRPVVSRPRDRRDPALPVRTSRPPCGLWQRRGRSDRGERSIAKGAFVLEGVRPGTPLPEREWQGYSAGRSRQADRGRRQDSRRFRGVMVKNGFTIKGHVRAAEVRGSL